MSTVDHRTSCRLCMRQPGSYNIYETSTRPDTTLTMAARITWVTQIELSADDGYSKMICGQCSIQLDAAYSFIEQCLATDKAIHEDESSDDEGVAAPINCPITIKQEVNFDESNGVPAGSRTQSTSAELTTMHPKFETPTFALSYDDSEPGSFMCAICEGVFKSKESYFTHIRLHAREKPNVAYECSKCKRIFNCPSHLKRHLRSHTGDKPYKCTVCPKEFYRMDHLKKHTMSHTGERPWSCTLCPKAFARRDHLMNHVKIHDKTKPFECTLCGKSFFKESSIVKHMKTHVSSGLRIEKTDTLDWGMLSQVSPAERAASMKMDNAPRDWSMMTHMEQVGEAAKGEKPSGQDWGYPGTGKTA